MSKCIVVFKGWLYRIRAKNTNTILYFFDKVLETSKFFIVASLWMTNVNFYIAYKNPKMSKNMSYNPKRNIYEVNT